MMWLLKFFLISCLLKAVPLVDDFGQNSSTEILNQRVVYWKIVIQVISIVLQF